ncbi:MAG: ABC transporter ATP-binding protein, partial [Lachnospiraceae bacterium]|nr:ABC transporter ATP-binding protein [Lachnospiraceae bacterium]
MSNEKAAFDDVKKAAEAANIAETIEALPEGYKTVMVIAHRLQSVMNADKIIVLDDGIITEEGNHEELLKKGGRYAALWN